MRIKEINNKQDWEKFFLKISEKTFLQSWNWGEFNKKMGNKIWRLGVIEKEEIIALALISKIKAKRGTYLLIQHGPVIIDNIKYEKKEILNILLKEFINIGNTEKASFVRMNPLWEDNKNNQSILKDQGIKNAPTHANAYEATWKLDIVMPEQEILMNMRKTTRYLIKKTLNNSDITVEKTKEISDINKYLEINKKVSERKKFVPFSDIFIENEFKIFSADNQSIFLFGKHKGKIISSALIVFWSGIAYYHQAASVSENKKLSIPYLVIWEAIKEAKKRNCVLFDFWGYVDPKKKPKHPWAGPTLFKMGFGGYNKNYIKTQDFPLNNKYWLIYIFEKLRNIKRFGF